jgi:fermentation-respiration switch protein FrsA (DUF1100 family)
VEPFLKRRYNAVKAKALGARALVAFFAALLLAGCTGTFFQPDRRLAATPAALGLAYQPVSLHAIDGTELFAWFLPARGEARATVLFLHGNAENISTHFANVAWMPAAGFNVLALDYRGYGGSAGTPSLAGVQLDIDAAMRALVERRDLAPKRIVVLGQSLGGALAIYYVAHSRYRDRICALITDSAFSDYRRIASEKLAGFALTWPLQWLPALTVDDDYAAERAVAAVSPIPLVLIHGDADAIVPASHAQRLFERAAEPKALWRVPGAGHIQGLHDADVRRRLTETLENACG